MEEGAVTRVLNDFLTVSEGEISLKKGDIVQVLEKVDRHWWYGSCGGRYGKFPGSYLISVEVPSLEDNHELFATVADFPRQQDGDLSFTKGELIVGTSQVNENWWYGRIYERTGIFPTTHTWQLDSKPLKSKSKCQVMNKKARVKMSMKAQLDEEMDLHEGDIVIVTEIIDKNWCRGICGTQEGVFPSAYVEILDGEYVMGSNETSHSNEFKLPVQLPPESSYSVPRPKSNDIDSLLALSPEAQFPAPNQTTDVQTINDSNIFDDDYFKVNMPSIYRSESENRTNKSETYNAQALLELDIVPYGITLYPFFAQFDNELSFHEGEIITLCRHIDKDWIEGKIDGRKGIFPKSYVNILVDCENYKSDVGEASYNSSNELQQFSHDMNSETELTPNLFATVLYNFDAQMNGDLTVHKDDVVWIVRKANEDWCEVRNQSGKVGLCPQNYLTPHLLPNELQNKLLRGTSLAADNLLGLFSSTEENANNNYVDTHVSSDGSRRKFQSHDFNQQGSVSPQNKSSIEDLISRNLDTYHISAQTLSSHPSHRYSMDLSENRNASFMSENGDKVIPRHRLSLSPKLQREEFPTSVPHKEISELTRRPSPFMYEEVSEKKPIEEPSNEETPREEGEMEMRCHPRGAQSHFQRQELSRHSSDRLPHRPPPPVPVPGQKPVRRSLDRCLKQSTALPECTVAEEKAASSEERSAGTNNLDVFEERRKKNAEQRQNVITELVYTEKEYVRDLKITYEIFNLHNPRILEDRGIDVKIVFGNILEVMQVAEDMLDKLQLAMKGKSEDDQCVGPCFVEMADQMKCVYGQYCMNHNNALMLLEKYESVEEIQILFKKGIETLRLQVACFDMGSILIKPVQRILKYPLILNELIKCTENSHKDKPELLNAVRTMMDVATYINEYKRRKDIVSKYLDDGNPTMSSRMSRISLHSVAKMSARLGVMLTSTLFGIATKDPVFDEHEFMFHTMEKTVRSFLKDVEIFLCGMHETMTYQLNIGVSIVQFYQESNSEAEEFHKLQQLICKRFWVEFKKTVEKRVMVPLNTVMELFEGPAILVQKRHDKLLDYDGCFAKAEKNKENRLIQEELLATKSNYEALNNHLLEELPTLNSLACEVLVECLEAFIAARKMLSGKITKEYLALMETPFMKSSQGDAIESFPVKHNLAWNQLGRFSFSPKSVKTDTITKRNSKSSPTPTSKQLGSDTLNRRIQNQSPSQQAFLQSRYSQDMLYCVVRPYTAADAMELTVNRGNIVAVIKKHNPLGDTRTWFVDDGSTKGFVPSSCLEPLYRNAHSASPTNVPSCSSNNSVPSQEESQNSDRRRSQVRTPLTLRPVELPPPSYDEVVSSADSSPHSDRSRVSAASEHEYHTIRENENENHVYEEIPEPNTSTVYENAPSTGDGNMFFYAAYDFDGSGMHMLSIRSGQVVFVVQQQDIQGNPEWWLVEDRFGKKGYVPGNYLRKYEQ